MNAPAKPSKRRSTVTRDDLPQGNFDPEAWACALDTMARLTAGSTPFTKGFLEWLASCPAPSNAFLHAALEVGLPVVRYRGGHAVLLAPGEPYVAEECGQKLRVRPPLGLESEARALRPPVPAKKKRRTTR